MSKTKQATHARLITPAGILDWPYFLRPDTEFDPGGVYKTKIKFDESDIAAKQLIQQISDLADEAFARASTGLKEGARPPKRADLPFYVSGGQIVLTAKLKATGVRKDTGEGFTQAPRLEDAAGAPWDVNRAIWSGSTARLMIEVVPFNVAATGCGVSLRLRAAQILKLADRGTTQGSVFGATEEAAESLLGSDSPGSAFDADGDF